MIPETSDWMLNCIRCESYKTDFCTRKNLKVLADEYCIYFKALEGLSPEEKEECGNCQFFSRKFCIELDLKLNTFGWCLAAKIRQKE